MPVGPARSARPPSRRGRPVGSIAAGARAVGETPITPFQAAYYLLLGIAVAAAWVKGGHPERLGALAVIVVFVVSMYTHQLRIGPLYVGDAVVDVLLTAFFVWMALTRDRWWPLFISAVMVLTLLVYAAPLLVPEISAYAVVSARVGLGILMALALLAGVGERWLMGEVPVFNRVIWRPRRPAS